MHPPGSVSSASGGIRTHMTRAFEASRSAVCCLHTREVTSAREDASGELLSSVQDGDLCRGRAPPGDRTPLRGLRVRCITTMLAAQCRLTPAVVLPVVLPALVTPSNARLHLHAEVNHIIVVRRPADGVAAHPIIPVLAHVAIASAPDGANGGTEAAAIAAPPLSAVPPVTQGVVLQGPAR